MNDNSKPTGSLGPVLLWPEAREWLVDCRARNLAEKTRRHYRQIVTAFQSFTGAAGAADVTAAHVRGYIRSLQDAGRAPSGILKHYRSLSAFFRWAVREELLSSDPTAKVRPPKAPTDPLPPAALGDIAALLKACTGGNAARDKAIFLTLLDSGLRAAELCGLDIGDLDFETGRIFVRAATAKGGKPRAVFVSPKTRRALLKYLRGRDGSGPLFTGAGGERLKYSGLRQIARRRSIDAGLARELPLHSFRRAFALNAVRSGMNVLALKEILGHSSLATTLRYVRLEVSDLQQAHEAAAPVDRLNRASSV